MALHKKMIGMLAVLFLVGAGAIIVAFLYQQQTSPQRLMNDTVYDKHQDDGTDCDTPAIYLEGFEDQKAALAEDGSTAYLDVAYAGIFTVRTNARRLIYTQEMYLTHGMDPTTMVVEAQPRYGRVVRQWGEDVGDSYPLVGCGRQYVWAHLEYELSDEMLRQQLTDEIPITIAVGSARLERTIRVQAVGAEVTANTNPAE